MKAGPVPTGRSENLIEDMVASVLSKHKVLNRIKIGLICLHSAWCAELEKGCVPAKVFSTSCCVGEKQKKRVLNEYCVISLGS